MEERVFLSVGILFHLDRFKDKQHQEIVLTLHIYCTHVLHTVTVIFVSFFFFFFGFVDLFSIKVDRVASQVRCIKIAWVDDARKGRARSEGNARSYVPSPIPFLPPATYQDCSYNVHIMWTFPAQIIPFTFRRRTNQAQNAAF